MTRRMPKQSARARQGFVTECTAQVKQIRGLLTEFGLVIPMGMLPRAQVARDPGECRERLVGVSRALFARLFEHFRALDRQVAELEREINAWHREDAASQHLQRIPGIGPLTASALAASVGDAKVFRNGRQFAAWLGLVPRQNSSGGKMNLLSISKRGDTYLRTMLIYGARSVLLHLKSHPDQADGWLARVATRRNPNIAAVALASKNARTVWALLAHGRDYQAAYRSVNPMAA
jgi:transposase